jgi:CRISPR/Cas system-associated exonuclease Cas4 (RecB family)
MNSKINITGTLIKNYCHCKRQAYLYYYGINFWNEFMRIGVILHKENKSKELVFEKIKIDDFDFKNKLLIEYKKTSSNLEGSIFQCLYYLKYLKSKGLYFDAKIIDLTLNKKYLIKLTPDKEIKLKNLIKNLTLDLSSNNHIPLKKTKKKNCKNCSFFDYCWC